MARCSFCNNAIEKGTGKMYVELDGRILNLCSTKCEKNMLKLKRKARRLKWTKFYVKGAAGKSSEDDKTKKEK